MSGVELADVSPRPWYYDGRDIFSVRFREGGHRLVIPLPDPTWHPSQRVSDADARFVVQAVNEYERLRAVVDAAYIAKHEGRFEPLHNALYALEDGAENGHPESSA